MIHTGHTFLFGCLLGMASIALQAQQNSPATGGEGAGDGGSFSFSAGLTDYLYVADTGGNMQYGMQQVPEFYYLYRWTGEEDSDWLQGMNWSNGMAPLQGHDIIIDANKPHDPLLTHTYEARHLEIASNAVLTISPVGKLTVAGTLLNTAGTEGLVLQSAKIAQDDTLASRTGSLIHHTEGVQATIYRHMTGGWDTWDEGWHLISSPVASQTIGDFIAEAQHGEVDFYGWDEPTETWKNFRAEGFNDWNQGPYFNPGQGYLVSFGQEQESLHFSGETQIASVHRSDLSNNAGIYGGWHLLGNPFTSALVWNDPSGSWLLNNIAGIAKIWIECGKSYVDIPGEGIIPASQGFWVQAGNGDNGLTIPSDARVHHAQPWYKSSDTETIKLVVREKGGRSFQESQIVVNPDAGLAYDFYFDSRFMPGYAPHFYSLKSAEKLSTYSLPYLNEELVVQYGFLKNRGDAFRIELLENNAGASLYLHDTKLGIMHDLRSDNPYQFTSAQSDNPLRFALHLFKDQPTGTVQTDHFRATRIWAYRNTLHVVSADPSLAIALYSTGGVLAGTFSPGKGEHAYTLTLTPGIYIARITDMQGVRSLKIAIQQHR